MTTSSLMTGVQTPEGVDAVSVNQLYPFGHDPHFNGPPPTAATARNGLRNHAKKLEGEIARIEAKQRELQDTIALLEQERQATRQAVEYHQAVLSPIRWLPEDLLNEVFSHCLPSKQEPDGSLISTSPFDRHIMPWPLTYVCRRWRHVAVSSPTLWPRNVRISFPYERLPRSISKSDGRPSYLHLPLEAIQLLDLFLDRSSPLPLGLSLSCLTFKHAKERSWEAVDLIRALFRHASRFEAIWLDIPSAIGGMLNSSFPPDAFSALHFAQLRQLGCSHDCTWLIDELTTAPTLRKMTMDTITFHPRRISSRPKLAAMFGQITTLTLGSTNDCASAELVLSMLAAMPNLDDCSVYVELDEVMNEQAVMGPPESPVAGVLNLTRLIHLRVTSDWGVESLLLRLVLPALQRLELLTYDNPSSIPQIIENFQCTITSFAFTASHASVDDINASLHNQHALKSLTVVTDTLNPLLHALVVNHGPDAALPICRNLQTIEILLGCRNTADFKRLGDTEIILLTKVISSRANSADALSPVQTIKLELDFVGQPLNSRELRNFFNEVPKFSKTAVDDLLAACNSGSQTTAISIKIDSIAGRALYCFESQEWTVEHIGEEPNLDEDK